MLTPTVNTDLIQVLIDGLPSHINIDDPAVLVPDNAGWHHATALRWPKNVTPMFWPPCSPELNPAENVQAFLQSHQLSNQVFEDYDAMLRRVNPAWCTLHAARHTLCRCPWIERALQA